MPRSTCLRCNALVRTHASIPSLSGRGRVSASGRPPAAVAHRLDPRGEAARAAMAALRGEAALAALLLAPFLAARLRRRGAGRLDPVGLADEIGRQRHHLDLLAGEPLDALEIGPLVLGAVGDGDAGGAGARGAAD